MFGNDGYETQGLEFLRSGIEGIVYVAPSIEHDPLSVADDAWLDGYSPGPLEGLFDGYLPFEVSFDGYV
jgi:hypothetical protein